jgi:hypothetical protein
MCSGTDDTCACRPASRDAPLSRCMGCGAKLTELGVTDLLAARPFRGAPIDCPGADPALTGDR